MNVLFVANDPNVFVVGSSTRKRMLSYASKFTSLHIVSRSPKKIDIETTDGNLVLHGIATGRLATIKTLAQKAHELILSEHIDVVSAQDPFEHGRAALLAVQGTPAKLHIQVHTDFLSPWFVKGEIFRSPKVPVPVLNRVRRKIADSVLPKADGIRTVSVRVRDSLVARYGTKIKTPTIIPIAPPQDVVPKVELPPHPFTFTFMTVSRLEPEKRIEDIITAFNTIKDRYPAAGIMIVGEGKERVALQDMVVRLGLMGRIKFLGDRPDARGLMQSAQCFIQASAYEGYGMTLIEAALARVPIITTDVGIVGEVFKGYEDVLAAPPGDPAALALNMIGMIEDNATRENLVRSAEAKAKAHLEAYADLPECIARDLSLLTSGSSGV